MPWSCKGSEKRWEFIPQGPTKRLKEEAADPPTPPEGGKECYSRILAYLGYRKLKVKRFAREK